MIRVPCIPLSNLTLDHLVSDMQVGIGRVLWKVNNSGVHFSRLKMRNYCNQWIAKDYCVVICKVDLVVKGELLLLLWLNFVPRTQEYALHNEWRLNNMF